jgi:hypothetical protein
MEINTLYTEFTHESEETILYNITENFNQLLGIIKTNLSKCKYKKVIEEISAVTSIKGNIFCQLKNYWKITEYKLEALQKLILKKLTKYKSNSKSPYPLKALDSLFKEITEALGEWSYNIDISDNHEDQIDSFTYFTLFDLYLNALHLKNTGRYFETMNILSIAEKLIKEFVNKCTSPKTLHLCQNVYLLISSIMIADGSFETAKLYHYYSLQLIIKEMFYRSNIDDKLYNGEILDPGAQYGIKNMFINFCLIVYQRGVCEENLDNIDKAIECYRQSNWAAKKFLRLKVPEFVQFLHYLEDKAIRYKELLEILIKESIQREKKKENDKKAIKQLGRELIDAKYEKMREEVEKVIEKIPENPLDQNHNRDSSPKKAYIMSTLDLVDKLLSKDYREVVKDANNIKLFEMDREFRENFKKKISHIRITKLFNERAKELFNNNKYPTLTELYSLVRLKDEKRKTIKDSPNPGAVSPDGKKRSFLQIAIDRIKARSKSFISAESAKSVVTGPTTAAPTRGHNRVKSAMEINLETPIRGSIKGSPIRGSIKL